MSVVNEVQSEMGLNDELDGADIERVVSCIWACNFGLSGVPHITHA